ncbi:hypothetical protein ES703_84558 [subsurface metagenome]
MKEQVDNGVLVAELFEDGCVCTSSGFAETDGCQVESVEENPGELLWRINIKNRADVFVNPLGDSFKCPGDFAGHFSQQPRVQRDAVVFHSCQDRNQGYFNFFE